MRFVMVFIVAAFGQAAAAQTTPGCNPTQTAIARAALDDAKSLTIKAAAAVGDTGDYARWFGDYTPQNAEILRANLKAIATAIRTGAVVMQCQSSRDADCSAGEFAWVYPHEPYRVYLCPPFFTLPHLTSLRPQTQAGDLGTREGTLVHEISHFNPVARTHDHCYSRRECSAMAQRDPARAIENADSYQYFVEDVTYSARQPVAGKADR